MLRSWSQPKPDFSARAGEKAPAPKVETILVNFSQISTIYIQIARNKYNLTGGTAGGRRFLSVDKERELRENVLRRNSEASVVTEHSEDGREPEEQEEMESEQGEMEDDRSKGDERTEDRGHGGREEGMIRTGQVRTTL